MMIERIATFGRGEIERLNGFGPRSSVNQARDNTRNVSATIRAISEGPISLTYQKFKALSNLNHFAISFTYHKSIHIKMHLRDPFGRNTKFIIRVVSL